jgi:taurine dioxygenase
LFGEVEDFRKSNYSEHLILQDAPEPKILRVTGELNEHGVPGVAGFEKEFEWHCDRVSDPRRKPLVWLYGVKGTAGSRTSWINNIISYRNLPESKKTQLQNVRLNVGSTVQFTDYLWEKGIAPPLIQDHRPNLIYTNPLGITGLYFSWNQLHFIENMDSADSRKLIDDLRITVERPEYIYDHDWQDGDVVISEQYLSIHKRWEFKDIGKRMVHRLAMDLSNIDVQALKNLET